MRISDWSSDVCSSDLEEEPQRADDAVHRWCGDARLLLLDLELPDILGARGVGRAPEPGREPSDIAKIITLRLLREAAHGHVVDQALAQRADRANLDKLVHRSTPQVKEPKRSEEHTAELQSLMRNSDAVFCLKKKKR